MKRLPVNPRPDWRERVEGLGFRFHTMEGEPYWDETACYSFTAEQVDTLETATNDLEQMCLQLVDHVVSKNLYSRLAIPEKAWDLIRTSWQRGDKNLYGRFDLCYDGEHPPKLLEYNADTPTALYEASVVQWDWLETLMPGKDQFNSIHERLIEAWKNFGIQGRLHFACINDHMEDLATTEYLQDTALQAGIETSFIHMPDIGWDGTQFVDMEEEVMTALFKLYPWEWMIVEDFAKHITDSGIRIIEPPWKMVLSNKAMLALLWEMFPGHPNLLHTTFSAGDIKGSMVKKPIFGREGANVSIESNGGVIAQTSGDYGQEGFVYQEYCPLPCFDARYPVIGAWVVASESAGIGIREDKGPITSNMGSFVPHYFE